MINLGELFTRWTIRVALGCYVAAVAAGMVARRRDRGAWDRAARLAWTAGLVLYLAHVVGAFQFYHGWSHAAAYEETARQTAELFGMRWGGGLYLNYAFSVAWLGDVLWWWVAPARYWKRPRALSFALHGFLAFMAFNATVVFEAGPVRWGALGACGGLGLLWYSVRAGAPSPGPR